MDWLWYKICLKNTAKSIYSPVKKIFATSFLVVLVFSQSCKKDLEPQALNLPPEAAELIESDNSFGLKLYRLVSESVGEQNNILISPLSVSLALSMACNGAEGDTRVGMEQALERGGLSRDEINSLNQKLVTALLAHDPAVSLEIANSIWYRDDFQVRQGFIQMNQDFYDARVSALDFGDAETKDVINKWVADQTHNRIDKIVDQISPESFMFLINAIYFKGSWRYQFDKQKSFETDFFLDEETRVPVTMMRQEADVNYQANDLFSAIELPYGRGNWAMYLFVPQTGKNLNDLTEELTPGNWLDWISAFAPAHDLDLLIPRFSFEFEQELNEVLKEMGMELAFSSLADFSGILEGGGLQISKVKHKSFIEVNEEGTEAAAVTSVEMELTSAGNYFAANKPFLFVIAEKSSSTILFIGSFQNPAKN